MKFKIFLPLIIMLCTSVVLHAQKKGLTQFNISYNAALPMGSFKDNLSENSFRGFKAGIMHGLNDNFSIGFGTGYQDFYRKLPRSIYKFEDGSDISAVRTHSIQTIPLLIQGKYSFNPQAAVQPYVALGAGGNIITYMDMLGEFVYEEKVKFGLAARPEAGIQIPFGKTKEASATFGASYNFMPVKIGNFNNLNNVGLHLGVNLPMRNR
jgi:Outer membrane protein beta-barrel domain